MKIVFQIDRCFQNNDSLTGFWTLGNIDESQAVTLSFLLILCFQDKLFSPFGIRCDLSLPLLFLRFLYSQVSDSSHQDNLHHSGILDFNQPYGVEPFQVSGFENAGAFDDRQMDYSLLDSANPHYPQPDYHQSAGYGDGSTYSDRGYDLGNMGQQEHHSFNAASQHQVMHCSSSHSNCPSIGIDNQGLIYKHTSDSSGDDLVGQVVGRSIYNSSSHYLGYAGTDGKVYDNHNHCVGWVNGCHVYNKGGVEVYETTKGVIGAAAYLLCVYYGGVN